MVAEGFPGMDIGHVQLDHRTSQNRYGIAQGDAVMCPGSGVNQNRIDLVKKRSMHAFAHLAFMIRLKTLDLGAELSAQCLDFLLYLSQSDGAVLFRVAMTEHVEVDTIEEEDFHNSIVSRPHCGIATMRTRRFSAAMGWSGINN